MSAEVFFEFIGILLTIYPLPPFSSLYTQPLMSIIFGNLTESFVQFGTAVDNLHKGSGTLQAVNDAAVKFRHDAAVDAAFLCYLGLGILAATFIYMFFWVYTGEVGSKRLREQYLRAVLRQDIAYFDNVGAGEVATRIQTDTREWYLETDNYCPIY